MVVGKQKGNSFENKIYRELKQIWPTTKKTLGSGSAKDEGGDIVAGPFLIDTKHIASVSKNQLYDMLDKIYSDKEKFSKDDKDFHGLIPILLYKIGGRHRRDPTMVMYDLPDGRRILQYYYDWYNRQKLLSIDLGVSLQ
jgi:hypothetical protein